MAAKSSETRHDRAYQSKKQRPGRTHGQLALNRQYREETRQQRREQDKQECAGWMIAKKK